MHSVLTNVPAFHHCRPDSASFRVPDPLLPPTLLASSVKSQKIFLHFLAELEEPLASGESTQSAPSVEAGGVWKGIALLLKSW